MHTPLYFYKNLIKSILCNPNAYENDRFLETNRAPVRAAVGILSTIIPICNETIYRGVLLSEDKNSVTLKPQASRQYNSFSSSLSVALDFANPSDPLSFPLLIMGKRFGYIFKTDLINKDILFHHKWGEFLGIYNGQLRDFMYQKEVILFDCNKNHKYLRVDIS